MDKAKSNLSIIFTLSIIAILISIFVVAKPNTTLVPATNAKSGVPVIIPAHAVEVSDGVFDLGFARDVDGKVVQGFLLFAKPGTVCGNGICEPSENANKCPADCGGASEPPTTSSCFATFAKGARWKVTEDYGLDTTNTNGLSSSFIQTVTDLSLDVWDDEVSFEIFGVRDPSIVVDGPDDVSPDGKNEVQFLNLGPSNTIAYTIVWGIFRGPPSGRILVEWDAVFNDDYDFGDADVASTTVMDYQNIASHEFGHSLGLAHPGDTCTEETMYAFAAFNETKKRSIEAGDIAGVNKLYS